MDDREIIEMYLSKNSDAVKETADKYGKYCRALAKSVLGNDADSEECVNDAYLKLWHSIPPNHPQNLGTYLKKIVRNLAFDRYRSKNAEKRGGGELELVLDELAECVGGRDTPEHELNRKELVTAMNTFLETLPKHKRSIFVLRYWYAERICVIAKRYRMTESSVSVSLNRIRKKLKKYLEERGFEI